MEKEFEKLYAAHGRAVWAVAYARGLNAEAANDVLQETYLRLWRKMLKGSVIRQARAWLIRVARNLAEDFARSSFQKNGTISPEIFDSIGSKIIAPDSNLVNSELKIQIRNGLLEISPTDREILSMRYALDFPVSEIAQSLGLLPSAVHMRLSRARTKLADILKNMGVEVP